MIKRESILITGGMGYIGSHIAVALLKLNHEVILFDNLKNSQRNVLQRITMVSNQSPVFVCGDLLNTDLLISTIKKYHIKMVVHLAASKSIAESMHNPIQYYENNISGSLSLFQAMEVCGVKKLVFSSSSAVYGEVSECPIIENLSPHPVNPYGKSKWFIEEILQDIVLSHLEWKVMIFRYFNVVGAHASHLLSENPNDKTGNIFLNIRHVIQGINIFLPIYGYDFNTEDGTAIRDYVHVEDVAQAHVNVMQWMKKSTASIEILNLGSGKGWSVFDVIRVFEKHMGQKIPYEFFPRRLGDISISYACIQKAKKILNWAPSHNIDDSCLSFIQSFK